MKIYFYVCAKFEESLQFQCERFSNNTTKPKLSDEELVTILPFCDASSRAFQNKANTSLRTGVSIELVSRLGQLPSLQ